MINSFKDWLALKNYGCKWGELTTAQKGRLTIDHYKQFEHFRNRPSVARGTKMNEEQLITDIAEMKVDLRLLRESHQEHLQRHWQLHVAFFGCLISSVVALLISLL